MIIARTGPWIELLNEKMQGFEFYIHRKKEWESKCRFIARMDADDISPKTRFSSQLSFMENTAMDGVGLCVRIVNEQGDSVPSMQRYQNWINGLQTSEDISAYRFVELPLVNPTMTVKREVFEREFLDGDWPEDYDFWLRAMAAGYRFAKLPDPLYYWRDHPHRLTRSDARYSNEAFDRCRLKHLINGPLKNQRQIDLWGVGQTGKPWLRRLQQKGYEIRRAIDVNPRKIGTEIHGVQVISPSHLPPTDGTPLVIAVGAAKAREQISEFLLPRNYKAGINAWFVA